MTSTRNPGRTGILIALTAAATATVSVMLPTQARAVETTHDGATAATAAASCWEIKQAKPTAASGTYWLQTPTLQAPAQFQCDMTTDGGGWVLVGRGREGWQAPYGGQGVASALLGPRVSFATTQLSGDTINGLLDGKRVSDLADGIRLRRATSATGSTWQESRVMLSSRDRWTWSFGAGLPVASYSFGGLAGTGGSTNNFGSDDALRRINTQVSAAQAYTIGFAYGSTVAGTNSSTSYLWSSVTGAGSARPYTEVWLRPQLKQTSVQFSPAPDSGTPVQQNRPMVSTYGMKQTWGVTGLATSYGGEGNVEVQAFAESSGVVYVGGNFRYLQQGSGGQTVDQPYLAAFYRDSGEPVVGFAPKLNGQVKALAVLPNGNIVAGGQFSQANGEPATAIVALNRSTGQTDTSMRVRLENRITNGSVIVRSLVRRDSSLFIGGALTHVTGGGSPTSYQRGVAQVSATTGAPVASWNPEFNGTVVSVDSTADRLYAAGYFTTSRGAAAPKAAAVLRQPNSPLATPQWSPVWSAPTRANYQQAIKSVGNRIWVGGSEHSMFGFDASTFARTSASITNAGGDLQTISTGSGVVYGGCHCNNFNYQGATTWPTITGWTQADKIGWIGAWDATTGEFLPQFSPMINSDKGSGSWSSMIDSKGTLWTGGDYKGVRTGVNSSTWAGGFVRFAAVDTSAPATPSNVAVGAPTEQSVKISWSGSTGASRYEVIRDDRVVASVSSTDAVVPLGGNNRYFVRAVDAAGNRSASSSVKSPADPATDPTVVAFGSDWSYRTEASAPAAGWAAPGFDASSWPVDSAALGYGSTAVATNIDNPAGTSARAVTNYFRRTITVPNVAQIKTLKLTTWADDGIAIYVNGTEVGRKNLGTSAISYSRYADAAPRTTTAKAEPLTVLVNDGQISDTGPITIAAEVHVNYRSTPDLSFDLSASATYYTEADPKPVVDQPADPVDQPAEPDPLLAEGSRWAYRNVASAPAASWNTASFDDSDWSRGDAVLGFGSAEVVTNLDNPAGTSSRAITNYFRTSVEVQNAAEIESLTITTRADDGIAVYLNGTEVGRKNLGTGDIAYSRYADASPRTTTAKASPVTITVPGEKLKDGTLVIAVEVHLGYRSTPDTSFDLKAVTNLR